jgi:isopentenyl-diphosphate delta-isomerase
MTGGAELSKKINERLAVLASRYNIPISCGSQKAGIRDKSLVETYRIMRDVCPECFIIGNIGGHDLIEDPVGIASEAVSMIDADALAIHLNPLQEGVQRGEKVDYRGVLDTISRVVDALEVPVIVKETGAGICMGVAKALESVGVAAINVAGAGGTSWSAVEVFRNRMRDESLLSDVGLTFWDWGIPTAASLIEVVRSVDIPVIASGGIRDGIEIVKSIVLGAHLAGMAQPFLKAYFDDKLEYFLDKIIMEIKLAMFLVGAEDINTLWNDVDYVLTGELLSWVNQRGLGGG